MVTGYNPSNIMIVKHRIEVIVSKSDIITKEIAKNLTNNLVGLSHIQNDYRAKIGHFAKIDLLIIDAGIDIDLASYRIKTIINLVKKGISHHKLNVCLEIPTKLENLLYIIRNNRTREQLFCTINSNWIYDERLRQILKYEKHILFTEKENEAFKYLLLASDNIAHKDDLLNIVWHYHANINSTTVESHMSRLKQKLPNNSIEFIDNCYKLVLANII
ncbi:MAG: winged helix family transcriptional regulator [Rickettsiaceae bacterium]|nr:MAG: winged helix family transcriptional regulator [Rickettsiaceae bacterium]